MWVKILIIQVYLFNTISSDISAMEFRTEVHAAQESSSNCVMKIARKYFEMGSIVCIVTSGLKNVLNKHTGISTDVIILNKMMGELQWNLMTKEATDQHYAVMKWKILKSYQFRKFNFIHFSFHLLKKFIIISYLCVHRRTFIVL